MRTQKGVPPGAELATEAVSGLELWRAAGRWRREVEADLASLELTLPQWVILSGLRDVTAETGDAASQSAIAERSRIDKMTVSTVMRALEARGFVDRAPAAQGRVFRIWITSSGLKALNAGTAQVERSSRAVFGKLRSSHSSVQALLRLIQAPE
jgi:DNA-binding MarR family transcriptional regulator